MKKNTGSQHLRNCVIQSEFDLRPKVAALAVAACFSSVVLANPTAPTVVHGTASFAQAGSILNVTNSHNAIINWGSFSIGVNELTKFIQPSALSAVLNRVVGQDPSAILGALQSNGRVFLINPNGILFGAGAQINVAGLVASTLNMSNADFLAGRMNFTDGVGAGAVVNQGSINASGGPVYMVGNAVTNNGIITSPGGEIVLAAGNSVELVNPGTPNLRVEIQAGDNEARNLGSVVADAGRIGIYAGLIKQGGVLNADSAVAEGGRIMLKSTKRTDLEAGSVTSARGTSGGQIIALSGMTDGVTNVAGTMDVSATAGDGGFIETSAARVNVADSALIKASGGVGGKGGTWLIDPADFYIDDTAYGGNISGATLSANLNAGTTVMIDSDLGTAGYGGSIFVNEAVSWSSAGGLTLIARNDVVVNSAITNGGTGDVKLYAGWDGGSTSIPVVGTTGVIDLHAAVSTGGNVHLIAGGDIIQDLSSPISAAGLLAISNAGSVSLDLASNSVGTIAGKAVTNFKFKNAPSLTVDTVGGVSGITVENPSGNAYAKLELAGSGSSHLYVNKDIRATGGSNGGNAEIYLNAVAAYGGNIFVTDATVSAIGGTSSSSYGGTATVNVYASGGDLTISGSQVLATGGVGASEYQDGNANINLTAYSGGIGITDSSALIATGYEANVDLNAYSFASVTLANSSIQAAGKASADGGEGNVSIYSSNGSINAGSGTISATGNTNSYYKDSEVNLSGLSGVTLGSVTATHYVSVYSANGAIVDGNTGLNISAPEVYLNGYSGVGSIANPLETLATELRVSSGNGDIGIINTGNLWLYAYDAVYAPSGNAAIETTGILTVDGAEGYAGGDLSLLANGDINITGYYGSVRASGNLLLQAGGNLNIGGAGGYYNYAYGYSNTVAVAGGNLNVLSGDLYGSSNSILGTSSNTTVTTGGNVVVDRSTIYGYPEVNMQVGGTVSINGVFGNSGRIEAGSPSTINVEFTKLTGGGYSVNGVDGAIYDALTNSGFVVLGDPAVLGATMMVTYSGVAATISPPTETLIVAMNQAITPPEKEQSTGAIESEDEKNKDKKKDLPICGK
jgi:filamentous hemagglutinin family protein